MMFLHQFTMTQNMGPICIDLDQVAAVCRNSTGITSYGANINDGAGTVIFCGQSQHFFVEESYTEVLMILKAHQESENEKLFS